MSPLTRRKKLGNVRRKKHFGGLDPLLTKDITSVSIFYQIFEHQNTHYKISQYLSYTLPKIFIRIL